MKKLVFFCALFISIAAYGQFNTGSVYFSGLTDANLGLELTESNVYLPYGFFLEGGYFVKNRMAVGGSIHTHGSIGLGEFANSSFEFRFGPNFRYYLPREDDLNIYLYAHPYYGFYVGSFNMYGFYAGTGTNYFITERIALEGRVSYNFHRQGLETFYTNYHRLLFEFGISVFFPSITFFDQS